MRCPSCDSIRHLLADCPDSYENLRKFRSMALAAAPTDETEAAEDAYFTSNLAGVLRKVEQGGAAEDIILYTGNRQSITELGGETLGCLLLDCGCSSNVAGEGWWRSYKASLPAELQKKVQVLPSLGKKFRFGGGKVLPSTKLVKFPGKLAGQDVMFISHVVDSNIPLLWSRPAMARAGTLLDLPGDRAKILGRWVELNLTGVGHYSLDILPRGEEAAEQCLATTLPTDVKEKEATLRKLHRQFGHPRQEVMMGLLKKVNCDDKESRKLVSAIHDNCATCKRFSPTPPRPVVSPPAMYAGRKAFSEAMCDEKVRKALRHKVRAVERSYEVGEQVYYRRDGDKAAWRGPATILAHRGSAGYFLEHQGDVVRVAACRIVAVEEADGQMNDKEEEKENKTRSDSTITHPGQSDPYGREGSMPPHEIAQGVIEQQVVTERRQVEPAPDVRELMEQGVELAPVRELAPAPEVWADAREEPQAAVVPVQPVAEEAGGEARARRPAGRPSTRGPSARRQAKTPAPPYPKAGDRIVFRDAANKDWKQAEVVSRGGKATSKNSGYYNVRSEGGVEEGVHLDKVEWRKEEDENVVEAEKEVVVAEKEAVVTEEEQEAFVALIPTKEHGSEECVAAKKKELEAFKNFGVYEEVKDEGQERLSSRWVMTDKSTETEKKVKARLVCRGFEETVEVQADSPTGSKETLHMLLAIAATKDWTIKSGDIKNAYLQGEEIDRLVHMEPPAELRRPGMVWRLLKAVYGMNDAGRKWYLKVEKVLTGLGCRKSLYDHCLFSYKVNGELAGILLLWVDDIFYAGTKEFEEQVMIKVSEEFLIGRTEEASFTYIGLVIKTTSEGITLDQCDYIEDRLKPATLKGGDNKRPLDKEEMTLLRRLTGKINWAASQTRPDLSYSVVELSTKFKKGELGDLKKANKAIVRLTSSPIKVLFPKITGGLKIVVYSDAAFQNLPDQTSSGRGHIVMLAGSGGRSAPLGWTSNKVRRVVHSTVAAEALSLQMALSHAVFLRAVIAETLGVDVLAIPIHSYIDSNNLHQAINSTKFVEDKRLRLDIAQIQECVAEHKVTVRWVGAPGMIADCLTKRGVKVDALMDVITSGFLPEKGEKKGVV